MLTQKQITQIQNIITCASDRYHRASDEFDVVYHRFPDAIRNDDPGCDPYKRLVYLDLIGASADEMSRCGIERDIAERILDILGYRVNVNYDNKTKRSNVAVYPKQTKGE